MVRVKVSDRVRDKVWGVRGYIVIDLWYG